jgi:hypothetical protein
VEIFHRSIGLDEADHIRDPMKACPSIHEDRMRQWHPDPKLPSPDPDPAPLAPPPLPGPDPDEPGPDLIPQMDPSFQY